MSIFVHVGTTVALSLEKSRGFLKGAFRSEERCGNCLTVTLLETDVFMLM